MARAIGANGDPGEVGLELEALGLQAGRKTLVPHAEAAGEFDFLAEWALRGLGVGYLPPVESRGHWEVRVHTGSEALDDIGLSGEPVQDSAVGDEPPRDGKPVTGPGIYNVEDPRFL